MKEAEAKMSFPSGMCTINFTYYVINYTTTQHAPNYYTLPLYLPTSLFVTQWHSGQWSTYFYPGDNACGQEF